jgi:Ca2+-transporting ATPase
MGKRGGKTDSSKENGEEALPAWAMEVGDVAEALGCSLESGLDAEAVATARDRYGFNELEKEEGKPLWKLVLEQFDDTLVKVR